MPSIVENNATSKLAGALSTSATSLAVTPGDGAKFPAPSAGNWFPLTLIKSDGSLEIVRCTARSTDTFTIARAQEGTGATAFAAGDRVELRLTKSALADLSVAAAAKLATARTIGGVSFDGSANINLPGVNATGNQPTTGNAATATKLATARTIGGVSFDGSANINLPGVNTAGNQPTTGNAATATKLATARAINGVAFDGTQNINIPASDVDFAIIYPNGGTQASPASVAINSRYVESNPFAGFPIMCSVELLYGGEWSEVKMAGSGAASYGADAGQNNNSSIVLVTGTQYLITALALHYFSGTRPGSNVTTGLPCRIKVWKLKGGA